ncbi:unnamed protein product [Strongylus vulgaris]|uniref:Uncharacterized protein n=1 Tax=Strongylus vulgaris TaxID=40348 RepID=A0A3P7JNV8_STRVU|nr:unnamed protein product [Strongylus vulgaris]
MKQAEKLYHDVMVDRIITQEMIADLQTDSFQDLEKYMQCLDISIIQFHTEKMAAINSILDDLWRKVYNGSDIQTIRIKSECVTSTEKRKAYDYRVVMIVNDGVELDMRDRCSAGQKMLACILIRIALADVFGGMCSIIALDEPTTNLDAIKMLACILIRIALADVFGGMCSIIALDEPTTNLDAIKVHHIAAMLNSLVAVRRRGYSTSDGQKKPFQMIIITHDDHLVDKLMIGSKPEFIYVLEKDSYGISHVKRQFSDGAEYVIIFISTYATHPKTITFRHSEDANGHIHVRHGR